MKLIKKKGEEGFTLFINCSICIILRAILHFVPSSLSSFQCFFNSPRTSWPSETRLAAPLLKHRDFEEAIFPVPEMPAPSDMSHLGGLSSLLRYFLQVSML